jgi:restriction system protein
MATSNTKPTIWGIHAGNTGDAATLFLTKSCVAVGWDAVGDLGKIGPNREAFKAAVSAKYPKKKPGAIPNNAGQ